MKRPKKLSPIYLAVVVAACSLGMTFCNGDEPEKASQQEVFLSSQHPQSKRWAILEDDGTSAWFYITAPDSEKPVADCFVYNRIPPIEPEKLQDYLNGPPPVTTRYAGPAAYQPNPKQEQFEIAWAGGGESAAVLMDGKPIAFILQGQNHGYSSNLTAEGPFGHPWNQKLFDQTFQP